VNGKDADVLWQVVFGTVVTRGPRSPLVMAAMAELEQACVLFSKAAVYSRRATKALVSCSSHHPSFTEYSW
jgi:hypothetical protein